MGCALGRRYSPPYTGGKACEVAFPVPRPNKLDCVSDEVIELYRGGKSLAEVAAVFGVAQTTVYTLLKKNIIARRPLSEANSIKWTEERKAKRARALRGKPSGALGKRWTYDRPITRPNSRGSLNLNGRVAKPCWACSSAHLLLIAFGGKPFFSVTSTPALRAAHKLATDIG
jgi:hypothetical protein